MKSITFVIFCLFVMSCTENELARNYGGSMKVDLPCGEKLVNVTWKVQDFWILTREMMEEESPASYKFSEKSNFGVMEGTIILVEHKCE